jgi:hypothetical protein
MPTHGAVAKLVRLHKERHPEMYCPACLWKTGGGYCPRHLPTDPVERHAAEAMVDPMISDEAIRNVQAHAGAMVEARDSLGRRPSGKVFRARLAKSLSGVLTVHPEPLQHEEPQAREPGGSWSAL